MRIYLNGEHHDLREPETVAALVDGLGLDRRRVAVELNRRILQRSEFEIVRVRDGDEVEVVTFVGGG